MEFRQIEHLVQPRIERSPPGESLLLSCFLMLALVRIPYPLNSASFTFSQEGCMVESRIGADKTHSLGLDDFFYLKNFNGPYLS